MKKKTANPPKASAKHKKIIRVTKDTDLSEYYDKDAEPSRQPAIVGYTVVFQKGCISAPDGITFDKCKFVVPPGSSSMIATLGYVRMDECHVDGALSVTTSRGLYAYQCDGDSINAVGHDDTAYFNECTFSRIGLCAFGRVHLSHGKAKLVFLHSIGNFIELDYMELVSTDPATEPVQIFKCTGTDVQVNNSIIKGSLSTNDTVLHGIAINNSTVNLLSFCQTVVHGVSADILSRVSHVHAYVSACLDFYDFTPCDAPFVTSFQSAGFTRVGARLYKKALLERFLSDKPIAVVLELAVPAEAEARFFGNYSKKIRVSEAKVVKVYKVLVDEDGCSTGIEPMKVPFLARIFSYYDSKFRYRIGKTAKPREPFDMSDFDCGSGIHGFLDPIDAANY